MDRVLRILGIIFLVILGITFLFILAMILANIFGGYSLGFMLTMMGLLSCTLQLPTFR